MTTLREAAQQALEALSFSCPAPDLMSKHEAAEAALRAALEQPEQEPVAWIQSNHLQQAQREPFLCRVEPMQRLPDFVPLYTHPPRREWRSLSGEEIRQIALDMPIDGTNFARAIEAALKERNA